jgi:tRNA threonylcarbamoyl adenosine modification protein YeaZ
MLCLALDTCFGCCSAALFDSDTQKIVAARHALMERGHAEAIAPMVQAVLAEGGVAVQDLERIAVTTGPGTFTGLRIGLALAQGLALGQNIPLVGLSSLLATAAPLLGRGKTISIVHKAGATGQFYVQHFTADGAPVTDIRLQAATDIVIPMDALLAGTGADTVAAHVMRERQHDLPRAEQFAGFAARLPPDVHHLAKPVYAREPDAKPQVQKILVTRVGADAAAVIAPLHAASFADGWRVSDIVSMLTMPGTLALIAQAGHEPAALLMARAVVDEAEILTIATTPRHRRKGLARHLLHSLDAYLISLAVNTLHLEAASDNAAALALYSSCGFERSGLRKAYYANGADAIMMRRTMP